jgi:mono/diheme cytochrome c family protein
MKALAIATMTLLALVACNRDRVETPDGATNDTAMTNSDAASNAPATDTLSTVATTSTMSTAWTDTTGTTSTDTAATTTATPNSSTMPTTDAAPSPTNQIADGQPVYKARCAGCHGADGKKNAANVILASKETQSKPDAVLIKTIRDMGPHRGLTLSDAQAAAVVSYIKALR